MDSDAVLSPDRVYRYRLSRTWDGNKPTLGSIMLNPSTADESVDDKTIGRCLGYAKNWGYGSILVGNLFAFRATDRPQLRECDNPIGPENDEHIREICEEVDMTVAAWGTDGALYNRGPEVVEMLDVPLRVESDKGRTP